MANGRPADGNDVVDEPDQFSPYGATGGYYYAKVTLDFWSGARFVSRGGQRPALAALRLSSPS